MTAVAGNSSRMASEIRETERKYEAPPGANLPNLDDLPGVAAESGPEEQRLEARYYDTGDLRLIREGVTLRRREGGSDPGWHLKLPAGDDTRREIRLPLGRATRQVPRELARLVRAFTRGEELRPVAEIAVLRQRRVLRDQAGNSLAEVAADDVSARTLGDETGVSRWREVEVELTGGGPGLLAAADERLRHGGLRPAGWRAKLDRALAGLLPPSRRHPDRSRRPGPHATAAGLVLAYAAAQVSAIMSLDPLVRRDEPDSVHQMRVATRRLRSTLKSFGQVLRAEDCERLADELRWLGGVLGAARDAEVLAGHVQAGLDRLPPELVLGPVRARIRAHFAPAAAAARAAVIEALDGDRYLALLGALDTLLIDPPLADAAAGPAAEVVPAAVRRAERRLRRRMRRALRTPAGPSRDAALHEARKAAKYARYAAEAAVPAFGQQAARFAKRIKDVQAALGDQHDGVVARGLIRELGVQAHLAGENAFTFGVLYGQDACQAADLEQQARRAWKRAARAARRWPG
jgi:CHAD domain-containing protein